MKESTIQTKILDWLKKEYPNAIVWKLSEQILNGIPDIVFIYKGKTIFFEVKKPGGKKKEDTKNNHTAA